MIKTVVRIVCLFISVGLILTVLNIGQKPQSYSKIKATETGIFILIDQLAAVKCNSLNISVNFLWCSTIVSVYNQRSFFKYSRVWNKHTPLNKRSPWNNWQKNSSSQITDNFNILYMAKGKGSWKLLKSFYKIKNQ